MISTVLWRGARSAVRPRVLRGLPACCVPARAASGLPDIDEDDLQLPVKSKMPRRRWMSVSDLATEVEQALVQGERLTKDGDAYANLQREATRLRLDNDAITAKVVELRSARAELIAQEEQVTAKLNEDGGFFLHETELLDIMRKIQKLDIERAGLRHKHHQNIKDVGYLKKTMSLIKKRDEVTSLIDSVEEALAQGKAVDEESAEAEALAALVHRLRDEYDRVSPKIEAHSKDMSDLAASLQTTEKSLRERRARPCSEADEIRTELRAKIQQAKRMIAQLDRLREFQRLNAQEIGMLERLRAKLIRQADIQRLLAANDAGKLASKVDELQEDTGKLRARIKDLESGLKAHADEATAIIGKLRDHAFSFSPETGKLREQLIANIHQESQWKERLAVLRGETVQNIHFLGMIKKALSDRVE